MGASDKTPIVFEEELVEQVEEHDTVPMDIPFRASTNTEWPPSPRAAEEDDQELIELCHDLDLAMGTGSDMRPVRNAGVYAVVRRPTTKSESNE